jgi:hypothetical protein
MPPSKCYGIHHKSKPKFSQGMPFSPLPHTILGNRLRLHPQDPHSREAPESAPQDRFIPATGVEALTRKMSDTERTALLSSVSPTPTGLVESPPLIYSISTQGTFQGTQMPTGGQDLMLPLAMSTMPLLLTLLLEWLPHQEEIR